MRKVRWITACLLAVAVTSVSAEEWKKEFMLYGWLAGLEGTVGIGDVGSAPVSATFDDLWGFVDFAMAATPRSRMPRNLFLADVSCTGLSDERAAMVRNQDVTVDLDINQWIVEVGTGYRISSEFDVGVGGSDFAWFGDVLVGYRFNERFSTSVAYRILSLDRQPDEDNFFLYDITQSGLGVGLGFGF